MLKQIVQNTWTCDGLNCPTPPKDSPDNPFFTCRVHKDDRADISPVEVVLCDICIQTITAPPIVQAVAEMRDPPQ